MERGEETMSDPRPNEGKYGGQGEHGKPTDVTSPVPEKKEGEINPSAPNDVTVTPGSMDKQK